jgi:hypothetical protein
MSDPLATYLRDHLTGSHFAIKLLETLQEQYRDEELGWFALSLCAEIKQDQDTLQTIIDHVGKASPDLTAAAGWIAERASQFKLQRDASGGLGTFEALETLTLGIRGKLALWRALPLVLKVDTRVPEYDYVALAARAEDQFARVEERRLLLVQSTFGPKSDLVESS